MRFFFTFALMVVFSSSLFARELTCGFAEYSQTTDRPERTEISRAIVEKNDISFRFANSNTIFNIHYSVSKQEITSDIYFVGDSLRLNHSEYFSQNDDLVFVTDSFFTANRELFCWFEN